jgi:hypothetical protein
MRLSIELQKFFAWKATKGMPVFRLYWEHRNLFFQPEMNPLNTFSAELFEVDKYLFLGIRRDIWEVFWASFNPTDRLPS